MLLTVKAALKGFRLMILLEIDSDDDDFSVLLVGKPGRRKRMSIEPKSHLAHFLGEICSAQGDRGRAHVPPPMYFVRVTSYHQDRVFQLPAVILWRI